MENIVKNAIFILLIVFCSCQKQEQSTNIITPPTVIPKKDSIKKDSIITILAQDTMKETGKLELFEAGLAPFGFMEGIKTIGNGESGKCSFSAKGVISENTKDGYFILLCNSYYVVDGIENIKEETYIEDLPLKKGKYKIISDKGIPKNDSISAFYMRLHNFDVTAASYRVNLSKQNQIEITVVDTIAKIVKGTLNTYYYKSDLNKPTKYPVRVSFTDMKFEAKLVKE